MSAERAENPIPPEDLRPAQLGIVFLGKVVLGHLSATIVDLAHRGALTVAEAPGDDWLLTDLRGRSPADGSLLPFETTLLDGLFAGQANARLASLGPELIIVLDRTRLSLRRDAVRRGWLRRLRRDRRTPRGEQLLPEIRRFRQELRALTASGGLERRPDLAPYAMVFGLGAAEALAFTADDATRAQRRGPRDSGVPGSWLNEFGRSWMNVCVGAAGHRGRGGQSADFAHEWGVPAGHGHGNAGHAPGHSGHGGFGDHGGFGGFDGGGHVGHV